MLPQEIITLIAARRHQVIQRQPLGTERLANTIERFRGDGLLWGDEQSISGWHNSDEVSWSETKLPAQFRW
jgi:hypothetical protein